MARSIKRRSDVRRLELLDGFETNGTAVDPLLLTSLCGIYDCCAPILVQLCLDISANGLFVLTSSKGFDSVGCEAKVRADHSRPA